MSGVDVSSGDVVSVSANGVTNTVGAGGKALTFFTTSDPVAVSLPFNLTPPTRESTVKQSLSSYAATASQATYNVSYIATNGLTQNFSRITITAPAGTAFSSASGCGLGLYVITYHTTGNSQNCLSALVSAGSDAVTLVSPLNASAGDVVTVTVNGVTNNAVAGAKALTFSTTSDPVVVSVPFTLTAPTGESTVTQSLSSYAATASEVTYAVSYVATNGLTQNFSSLTITAPTGTAFSTATPCGPYGHYVITDNTTGNSQNCVNATVSAGCNAVTLKSPITISAGDVVTVIANGVANTSTAGGHGLTLSTTSDPVAVKVPFTSPLPRGRARCRSHCPVTLRPRLGSRTR